MTTQKENEPKKVVIYTDGACGGNPGPGGYGIIFLCETSKNGVISNFKKTLSGGEKQTTNNRMELSAVIVALSHLKTTCNVELFTDSKYVMDGATKWLEGWQKNNWKNSSKQPVANQELWQKLIPLLQIHNVNWHWVKGHNTDALNNEVDAIARNEIKKFL